MGIEPSIWGPSLWRTMHFICFGAPTNVTSEQLARYRSFFNALPDVIPCQTCADHLAGTLASQPLMDKVTTGKELFEWSVDLHNAVNERLHKKKWTHEEAFEKWTSIARTGPTWATEKGKSKFWIFNFNILILMVILLLVLVAAAHAGKLFSARAGAR